MEIQYISKQEDKDFNSKYADLFRSYSKIQNYYNTNSNQ